MLLKKIYYCLLFALLVLTNFLFSKSIEFDQESLRPDLVPNLNIYLESDQTVFSYRESIRLKVMVVNNSGSVVPLYVHPEKSFYNYYIEVFTKEGVSVAEKDSYFSDRFNELESLKEKQNQGQFNFQQEGFTSVNLIADKIIGDQVNLTENYDLKPGHYLVRVKFYPKTSIQDPLSYIYSPYIQIIIKPEKREQNRLLEAKQQWEYDKGFLKTPEDSVKAFFQARKEGNWDKFFYLLDLRQLITIFSSFNTAYEESNSETKDKVLEEFKQYLQDINSSETINRIEVIESFIRQNQAIVKVSLEVDIDSRPLSREYLFKLVKQNNWIITAYTVNIR